MNLEYSFNNAKSIIPAKKIFTHSKKIKKPSTFSAEGFSK
jgi:hypothetical protein